MVEGKQHALIIGASSALAEALAHTLAKEGYDVTLAGRDEASLVSIASNLSIRYEIKANCLTCDLSRDAPFPDITKMPDLLVMAAGTMEGDIAHLTSVNYTRPALWLEQLAEKMAEKGGVIAVIGSVAGDRGRQSNYHYGAAKAALHAFTSGLRNRYANTELHVMTIKPGFVDTPMTYGMQSPLIASREKVAGAIMRAIRKRRNAVYVPWFWLFIMLIITHIPERIFKKLKL